MKRRCANPKCCHYHWGTQYTCSEECSEEYGEAIDEGIADALRPVLVALNIPGKHAVIRAAQRQVTQEFRKQEKRIKRIKASR